MPRIRKSPVMITVLAALVGAAALAARGQSTARPGEPTQATVLVQNRNPSEAIPVVVQSVAGVSYVRLAGIEPDVVLTTRAVRQTWEYRSVILDARVGTGPEIQRLGTEGWEAVGIVQTSGSGPAVLLKRPR